MMIWPKYSSRPSILTRRSMASLIDSSRPLCTLTTYHFLLLGRGAAGRLGGVGRPRPPRRSASAASSAAARRGSVGGAVGRRRARARLRLGSVGGGVSGSAVRPGRIGRSSAQSRAWGPPPARLGHHSRPVGLLLLLRLLGVDLQHADRRAAQDLAPDDVHDEQEHGQQDHRHQHHDRVLDQPLRASSTTPCSSPPRWRSGSRRRSAGSPPPGEPQEQARAGSSGIDQVDRAAAGQARHVVVREHRPVRTGPLQYQSLAPGRSRAEVSGAEYAVERPVDERPSASLQSPSDAGA